MDGAKHNTDTFAASSLKLCWKVLIYYHSTITTKRNIYKVWKVGRIMAKKLGKILKKHPIKTILAIAGVLGLSGFLIFNSPKPVTQNEVQREDCESILQGSPYRYIYTEHGLVYQTCRMEEGRPVVTSDYKDQGYTTTEYYPKPKK